MRAKWKAFQELTRVFPRTGCLETPGDRVSTRKVTLQYCFSHTNSPDKSTSDKFKLPFLQFPVGLECIPPRWISSMDIPVHNSTAFEGRVCIRLGTILKTNSISWV